MIVDFDNNIVLEMRGYGKLISNLNNRDEAGKSFDQIANEMVDLINNS